MMKTTTLTRQFENSHGRKPRGDGLWIMSLQISDGRGSWCSEQFEHHGTLTEAKQAARQHIKTSCGRAKELIIDVLP